MQQIVIWLLKVKELTSTSASNLTSVCSADICLNVSSQSFQVSFGNRMELYNIMNMKSVNSWTLYSPCLYVVKETLNDHFITRYNSVWLLSTMKTLSVMNFRTNVAISTICVPVSNWHTFFYFLQWFWWIYLGKIRDATK